MPRERYWFEDVDDPELFRPLVGMNERAKKAKIPATHLQMLELDSEGEFDENYYSAYDRGVPFGDKGNECPRLCSEEFLAKLKADLCFLRDFLVDRFDIRFLRGPTKWLSLMMDEIDRLVSAPELIATVEKRIDCLRYAKKFTEQIRTILLMHEVLVASKRKLVDWDDAEEGHQDLTRPKFVEDLDREGNPWYQFFCTGAIGSGEDLPMEDDEWGQVIPHGGVNILEAWMWENNYHKEEMVDLGIKVVPMEPYKLRNIWNYRVTYAPRNRQRFKRATEDGFIFGDFKRTGRDDLTLYERAYGINDLSSLSQWFEEEPREDLLESGESTMAIITAKTVKR